MLQPRSPRLHKPGPEKQPINAARRWLNIQHFAFHSDPIGGGSTEDNRQVAFTDVGGADYLTLTIPVRSGAVFAGDPLTSTVVDGISYVILGNMDLGDPWNLTVTELVPALSAGLPSLGDYDTTPGPDWQYRTFRLEDPISASLNAFLRAGVSHGP